MSDEIEVGTEWYMPGLPTVRVLGATEMVVAVVQPQTNASWAVHLEDFLRLYRPVAPKPCEPRCHCGACNYSMGIWQCYIPGIIETIRQLTFRDIPQAICPVPGCNTVLLEGGKTCRVVSVQRLRCRLDGIQNYRCAIGHVEEVTEEPLTPDEEADHAAD